jgi:transposase InsO family protein
MPYTSNPHAPKARMNAHNDVVWRGMSHQQAALKYGVNRTTIWRWVKKGKWLNGNSCIETKPSTPHHHPNRLNFEIVLRIIELRKKLNGRCAPVIHEHLRLEGINVSLSSVKRTLKRHGLIRKRKQPRYYTPLPRPVEHTLGSFVQMDTIHIVRSDYSRFYVYTLIDVYSRMAYAEYHPRLLQRTSFEVLLRAEKYFGFSFQMIQTDNGPEFKDGFLFHLSGKRIHLRHSRVRKPNDNAHIERFNRTIQEECFKGRNLDEILLPNQLKRYLAYYNRRRLHLSLNLKTPAQFVAKVLS